jgi:ketosteroid isomerase-like protein
MKTFLTISILSLSLATFAFAAGAEDELRALEQQWADAYVKGDTAFLETIEADEYKLVDPTGIVATKARDIEELRGKKFVVRSTTSNELNVRMLGEKFAYVTGLHTIKAAYKGEDISGQYRFLDVFEKKGDKWQALVSQVTRVEKQ